MRYADKAIRPEAAGIAGKREGRPWGLGEGVRRAHDLVRSWPPPKGEGWGARVVRVVVGDAEGERGDEGVETWRVVRDGGTT